MWQKCNTKTRTEPEAEAVTNLKIHVHATLFLKSLKGALTSSCGREFQCDLYLIQSSHACPHHQSTNYHRVHCYDHEGDPGAWANAYHDYHGEIQKCIVSISSA